MSLRDMLRRDGADLPAIAAYLDGLSHPERLAETRTLRRAEQRRLYRAAGHPGAAPVDLAHFVPADVAPGAAVHHHGRNTLPLPGRLKLFEKRFTKPVNDGDSARRGAELRPQTPVDRSDRLFGYNQSPFLRPIGPGFFVALLTAGKPQWEAHGAVVIDYYQIPDGPVPAGWPEVVPNSKGLQRFVYGGTRDFMRRVSTHVSIGAAYKGEKALDHYFVLCREP